MICLRKKRHNFLLKTDDPSIVVLPKPRKGQRLANLERHNLFLNPMIGTRNDNKHA